MAIDLVCHFILQDCCERGDAAPLELGFNFFSSLQRFRAYGAGDGGYPGFCGLQIQECPGL
jgi:hypothetical protein